MRLLRPASSHLRVQSLNFSRPRYKALVDRVAIARCQSYRAFFSHPHIYGSAPKTLPLLPPPRRRTLFSPAAAMSDASFYSLKATRPGNKVYDFEQLKGKVVLIVNTASKWCAPPRPPCLMCF